MLGPLWPEDAACEVRADAALSLQKPSTVASRLFHRVLFLHSFHWGAIFWDDDHDSRLQTFEGFAPQVASLRVPNFEEEIPRTSCRTKQSTRTPCNRGTVKGSLRNSDSSLPHTQTLARQSARSSACSFWMRSSTRCGGVGPKSNVHLNSGAVVSKYVTLSDRNLKHTR